MTTYCTSEQNEDPSHNHAINGCKPWPGQCWKHHHGYHILPCPHCAADAELLEERIERVVDVLLPKPSGWDQPPVVNARREACRDALRDLVRGVRRG